MRRRLFGDHFDRSRLRWLLAVFFVALAVPAIVLVVQASRQIKWEAFHQHQALADELARRIDSRIVGLIETEEARSFGDYGFLIAAGDAKANFIQRSPLAEFPVDSEIPGLIGHFQLDDQGTLSTPFLPPAGVDAAALGVPADEFALRAGLERRILGVLTDNRLVEQTGGRSASLRDIDREAAERRREESTQEVSRDLAASRVALSAVMRESDNETSSRNDFEDRGGVGQAAFDALVVGPDDDATAEKKARANVLGKTGDLKLDQTYQVPQRPGVGQETRPEPGADRRRQRKEEAIEPYTAYLEESETTAVPRDKRVRTFESEIDPFDFRLLDSGHFVLFRKVWREGQRYIQGAVIDGPAFIEGTIHTALRETALSRTSDLVVAWQGDVVKVLGARARRSSSLEPGELKGELLHQVRMSAPLADLELIFSVNRLPGGPGGVVIGWIAAILAVVLVGGFWLLYRLGVGQIDLARQQQDFVSAVSHELKTPLTSIRMYGEMLKEGWASEEKKSSYYSYIYDESERLSRLIGNVLQLASLTRNDPQFDIRRVGVAELEDQIRSKIASQAQQADFEVDFESEGKAASSMVEVDADCFAQIVINLVDNAIKFSAAATDKRIVIGTRLTSDGTVEFSVRDFGPGIGKDQRRKIFRLFYRTENELTRETVGTGIGLALVHQLVVAMNGTVDVVNRDPGAEFRVSFPVVPNSHSPG